MKRTQRCDQYAMPKNGTTHSSCNGKLDERGRCYQAGEHISSDDARAVDRTNRRAMLAR